MFLTKPQRSRARDDDGVTMVLVALLLAVLMVSTAFAIDLGRVYNERGQDQSAADSAALGAAAQTSNSTAVTEAIELSRLDVGNPPSVVAWNAAYAACADSGRVARGFTVTTATTDCVSFNANGQRVRVRIPNIAVSTIFGRVVGINSFNSTAFAEAGFRLDQSGDVMPYGLPGSDAGSNEVCVKAGSNPNSPLYLYAACNSGPTSGNFRKLDITVFGNADLGTSQICLNGSSTSRAEINTALGVDHSLSLHPTGAPNVADVVDGTACSASNFRLQPNIVITQTGNSNAGLNEGMYGSNVGGITGLFGRLARGTNRITVRSPSSTHNQMDNTALSAFINPGRTDIPAVCKNETFDNAKSDAQLNTLGVASPIPWRLLPYPPTTLNQSKAHMDVCMTAYRAAFGDTRDVGDPVLFDRDSDGNASNRHYDIQDAPRFGFVPESWAASLGSGTQDFYIKRYKPLYLMSSYFSCNAAGCDIVHTAGYTVGSGNTAENIGVPSSGNKDMDAISGMLFTDNMLPVEIIEDAPGNKKNLHLELLR